MITIKIRSVGDMYAATNDENESIIYKETHDSALDAMIESLGVIGSPTDMACDGIDTIYTFGIQECM